MWLCPEDSPLFQLPIAERYYHEVAWALLERDQPTRGGLLSVVCLPCPYGEWALRLLRSENGDYSLALTVAEAPIWDSMFPSQKGTPVALRRAEAPLPPDLATVVCEAWRKMLLAVRHADRSIRGADGVEYHFACCAGPYYIGPYMAGWTWCPDSATPPGRLVDLSHKLRGYVEQGEPERSGLTGEIRQGAEWFREFPGLQRLTPETTPA
jgi:hypothetical protein